MMDADKFQITHYPSEVLGGPAKSVEKIDDNIRRLVDRMTDIMLNNKGVGLAAPQAGVPLRLFIISLDGSKENLRTYINPTVTPISADLDSIEEGCLSVPEVSTKIRRYKKCSVTATDLEGNEFTEEAEGLYARVLQHEYDHIEGLTIVSRMGPTARITHRKKLKKLVENHQREKNSG